MSSWREQVVKDLRKTEDRITYAEVLKKGKAKKAEVIDIDSARQGRSKTKKHGNNHKR